MSWQYQNDLRDEEIAEIERGDAEKTAQVEESAAEWAAYERDAREEADAAEREVRDHVARNTAKREQISGQTLGDAL